METRTDFPSSPMLVGHLDKQSTSWGIMVMSGGGGDPRDDPDESKTELIDCSYQNHAKSIFRKGAIGGQPSEEPFWMVPSHRRRLFRVTFEELRWLKPIWWNQHSMVLIFEGPTWEKPDAISRIFEIVNWRGDLRGIRGKYAIWQGSDCECDSKRPCQGFGENGPVNRSFRLILSKNDLVRLLKRQACSSVDEREKRQRRKRTCRFHKYIQNTLKYRSIQMLLKPHHEPYFLQYRQRRKSMLQKAQFYFQLVSFEREVSANKSRRTQDRTPRMR